MAAMTFQRVKSTIVCERIIEFMEPFNSRVGYRCPVHFLLCFTACYRCGWFYSTPSYFFDAHPADVGLTSCWVAAHHATFYRDSKEKDCIESLRIKFILFRQKLLALLVLFSISHFPPSLGRSKWQLTCNRSRHTSVKYSSLRIIHL